MAEPGPETASVRFRLYDGTDIGPMSVPLGTTVGAVKEAVLDSWPQARALQTCGARLRTPDVALPRRSLQDRERPEGPGALKIILSGRLLGNEVTLADARTPTDALVTMHLVVAPPKVRRAVPHHPAVRGTDAAPPAQQLGRKAPKAPVPADVAHPASSGCCVVS